MKKGKLMKKNDSENYILDILKRIDVLIALILKRELKENKSLKMIELIDFLSSFGLNYNEIANICGKSPSYIASELTRIKKKGLKNARKK